MSNGKVIPIRSRVALRREPELPDEPPPEKPTLAQRFRASPLTFVIAAINIAYFIWIESHGSSTKGDILVRFGAVETSLVRGGEYWRIASYMIVHIGWGHLLMNTWAGGSWCIPVERMLGSWRFLLIYLVAGLGGGAAVVIFSDAVTAGASGAMFGIIGAILTIRFRQLPTWKMFVNDRGVRSTVAQIALWTVLGIFALPMSQSGHFGGLITGIVVTYALTLPRAARTMGLTAVGVLFAGFLAFAAQPWAKKELDWSHVKVNRLGSVEDARAVEVLAGPACGRGVERACVIKEILALDIENKDKRAASQKFFEGACKRGDQDACAGYGVLVADKDIALATRTLGLACAAGSEWACEFADDAVSEAKMRAILESDAAAPDEDEDVDLTTGLADAGRDARQVTE